MKSLHSKIASTILVTKKGLVLSYKTSVRTIAFLALIFVSSTACQPQQTLQTPPVDKASIPAKTKVIQPLINNEIKPKEEAIQAMAQTTQSPEELPKFSPIKTIPHALFTRWVEADSNKPPLFAIFTKEAVFDVYSVEKTAPITKIVLPGQVKQNIVSAAPTTKEALWTFALLGADRKKVTLMTSATDFQWQKKTRNFLFKPIGTINDSQEIAFLNTANIPQTLLTYYPDGSARAWFLQFTGPKGEILFPPEGLQETAIKIKKSIPFAFSSPIAVLQLDPEKNRALVMTQDGNVKILSTGTQEILQDFSLRQQPIFSASFVPSKPEEMLILTTDTLSIIDIDTNQPQKTYPLPQRVTSNMSAHLIGSRFVAFHHAEAGILLWDITQHQFVAQLQGSGSKLLSITCDSKFHFCLATNDQNEVSLFELPKPMLSPSEPLIQ